MSGQKQTRPGRRKFIVLAGIFAATAALLRDFRKSPRISWRRLKLSFHPAQFYRKFDSEDFK